MPEPLTRMSAAHHVLAMEKQALLEDIALGNLAPAARRLAAIEQEENRLILALDTLQNSGMRFRSCS